MLETLDMTAALATVVPARSAGPLEPTCTHSLQRMRKQSAIVVVQAGAEPGWGRHTRCGHRST